MRCDLVIIRDPAQAIDTLLAKAKSALLPAMVVLITAPARTIRWVGAQLL